MRARFDGRRLGRIGHGTRVGDLNGVGPNSGVQRQEQEERKGRDAPHVSNPCHSRSLSVQIVASHVKQARGGGVCSARVLIGDFPRAENARF